MTLFEMNFIKARMNLIIMQINLITIQMKQFDNTVIKFTHKVTEVCKYLL